MNKKHSHLIFHALVLTAALWACGCATPVGNVETRDSGSSDDSIQEKVRFIDSNLPRSISVVRVNESVAGENLRKAQVVVVNTRSKAQNLSYKFEWYDSDGMLIESSASIWKPLRLLGKEQSALSHVAPHPRATDFVLKIRRS